MGPSLANQRPALGGLRSVFQVDSVKRRTFLNLRQHSTFASARRWTIVVKLFASPQLHLTALHTLRNRLSTNRADLDVSRLCRTSRAFVDGPSSPIPAHCTVPFGLLEPLSLLYLVTGGRLFCELLHCLIMHAMSPISML